MTDRTAVSILRHLGACDAPDGAIPWVEVRAPGAGLGLAAEGMWRECERGDWLIWLVSHPRVAPHLADSDRRLRLVACDCAEEAVVHLCADPRSAEAISVARRYAVGEATGQDLAAARAAAWDAARDAARAAAEAAWAAAEAAAEAAWAAAEAAEDAARDARVAAWDAAEAAAEAAGDAARDAARVDARDARDARDAAREAAREAAAAAAWAARDRNGIRWVGRSGLFAAWDAADAARAAADAARAAAEAAAVAARDAARAAQADIVRRHYTWAEVRRALALDEAGEAGLAAASVSP